MAAVYFLAYRGKSPLSRMIRFLTAGDYSHVGLAVTMETNGGLRLWAPRFGERPELELGAWGKWPWDVRVEVLLIDKEHRPGTEVDLFKLPCTESEAQAIFDFYLENEGAGYDWLGALTCLVRPKAEDKGRWFCSELAYAACLSAGVKLLNEDRPHKVTPRIFFLSPYLKRVGQFQTREV